MLDFLTSIQVMGTICLTGTKSMVLGEVEVVSSGSFHVFYVVFFPLEFILKPTEITNYDICTRRKRRNILQREENDIECMKRPTGDYCRVLQYSEFLFTIKKNTKLKFSPNKCS